MSTWESSLTNSIAVLHRDLQKAKREYQRNLNFSYIKVTT